MNKPRKDLFSFNPEDVIASDAKRKRKAAVERKELDKVMPLRFAKGFQRDFITRFKTNHADALRLGNDPKRLNRLHRILTNEVKLALKSYMIRPGTNLVAFLVASILMDREFNKHVQRSKGAQP